MDTTAVAEACTHWRAVACNEFATGEIVAWLCPDCDKQMAERPPLALPPLGLPPELDAPDYYESWSL